MSKPMHDRQTHADDAARDRASGDPPPPTRQPEIDGDERLVLADFLRAPALDMGLLDEKYFADPFHVAVFRAARDLYAETATIDGARLLRAVSADLPKWPLGSIVCGFARLVDVSDLGDEYYFKDAFILLTFDVADRLNPEPGTVFGAGLLSALKAKLDDLSGRPLREIVRELEPLLKWSDVASEAVQYSLSRLVERAMDETRMRAMRHGLALAERDHIEMGIEHIWRVESELRSAP